MKKFFKDLAMYLGLIVFAVILGALITTGIEKYEEISLRSSTTSNFSTTVQSFFLWGGFIFALLWHSFSWIWMKVSGEDTDKTDVMTIAIINLGLSGVALCGFGYLAFGT